MTNVLMKTQMNGVVEGTAGVNFLKLALRAVQQKCSVCYIICMHACPHVCLRMCARDLCVCVSLMKEDPVGGTCLREKGVGTLKVKGRGPRQQEGEAYSLGDCSCLQV